MGKARCMCLDVLSLTMWDCWRAGLGCLCSVEVVAWVGSCMGRHAGIDLLVVQVFVAREGCVLMQLR